jgi:hypothetical protein
MELLEPLFMPVVLLFGAIAAAVGVPLALADPEKRMRGVAALAGLALAVLFFHGELRSSPVVRAGLLTGAGALSAVLFGLSLRHWLLRRALLAERPRSPDEWTPGAGRRLWAGRLQSPSPLRGPDGLCCLYRRCEVDRWENGRWRRIATPESCAEELELAGRTRRMALAVPRAALRRAAREIAPYAASPDGWRLDPDPDPAALYRVRTLAVLDGTTARVLACAERNEAAGLLLQGGSSDGFQVGEQPQIRLGRQAGLFAAAALICALAGLWGAWG